MIESILGSSLKKQAKKLKADNISDISFAIKVVNDRYELGFMMLKKGLIVPYESKPYTPISKLIGLIDYAKYETFNGDKTLAKNIKKLAEKEAIDDYKSLLILVSYIDKSNDVKLTLFKGLVVVREIDIDELID